MTTIRIKLLLLLFAFAITSCGFKLKGSYEIPYQTVHVQADVDSRVARALKKKIERKHKDMLVGAASAAEVVISVLAENSTRTISVLSNSGRVDEYELSYLVQFRIYAPQDASNVLDSQVVLHRKITYSDQDIAAKSSEEGSLIDDMAAEAATRIMVQLSKGSI
ncbi:MAG: LPS assembly lipoprotein LptE [Proteobacteria bacterium]|nr:LPS assembly lipoprotein LptE [Pseudomonadota bacterium]MDA1331507.1 LPS assembly lipoprotein LptE [Pseudomonadota bacterium]